MSGSHKSIAEQLVWLTAATEVQFPRSKSFIWGGPRKLTISLAFDFLTFSLTSFFHENHDDTPFRPLYVPIYSVCRWQRPQKVIRHGNNQKQNIITKIGILDFVFPVQVNDDGPFRTYRTNKTGKLQRKFCAKETMSHADGHDQTKTLHQKCFHKICINLHTITLSVRMPAGAETNATAIAEPTVWTNYARRKLKSSRKKIDHVQTGNDRETIRKIFLTLSCVVCMVFTQSLPPAPTQSTSTGNVRRCTTLILWICDAAEGSGTKQNSAVGKIIEPK